MILLRSILKEMLLTIAAMTSILLLLFLSQFLVRYMKYAAAGRIAADTVFVILFAEIPRLLGILLPLGVYLGVVMALGRMRADRELLMMRISGFTKGVWAVPYSIFLLIMALLVLAVMGWLAPWASVKRVLYTEKTEEQHVLSVLSPGRFQVWGDGKQVVYVQQLSKHRDHASGIFIAETDHASTSTARSVVTADSASIKRHAEYQNAPYFELKDGRRYQGVIGEADYRVLKFDRYGFRLQDRVVHLSLANKELLSLPQLWQQKKDIMKWAELNWRLAIPVSLLVLGVLALLLSSERIHLERYVAVLAALIGYFVYMNVLLLAREWLERGVTWVVWPMHGLPVLILFISLLLMYLSGKPHAAS